MQVRQSLAAVIVPLLLAACGSSKESPTSAGGASPTGVMTGAAAAGGETSGAGNLSASSGAATGGSGVSGEDRAGASPGGSGGQAGAIASSRGGTDVNTGGALVSAGGAPIAGSGSTEDTGGAASGVPSGWIVVDDIDYSKVPGPNFDTVRLMFKGSPCSGSSCHFGGRNHMQVDKAPDQLYTYMMSFKTLQCGKLIDTANPSQSALVKYLRGPCGMIERMPSYKCFDDGDEQCVPEYYIQAIEQWIALGAPR
ncbi:MAG TPA: hypothetical protein VER11_33780 [Polyangiaceae bacterium]|nr:hypothetical protein [Polyangiaceae bacterium]